MRYAWISALEKPVVSQDYFSADEQLAQARRWALTPLGRDITTNTSRSLTDSIRKQSKPANYLVLQSRKFFFHLIYYTFSSLWVYISTRYPYHQNTKDKINNVCHKHIILKYYNHIFYVGYVLISPYLNLTYVAKMIRQLFIDVIQVLFLC